MGTLRFLAVSSCLLTVACIEEHPLWAGHGGSASGGGSGTGNGGDGTHGGSAGGSGDGGTGAGTGGVSGAGSSGGVSATAGGSSSGGDGSSGGSTGGVTGGTGGGAVDCGNGSIDAGEVCDGADLGGLACTDLGFDGGVLGCSSGCQLDPGGCTGTAEAQRIFITSTTHQGSLGGLDVANGECQTRADAANLGGAWKALLSGPGAHAMTRLQINGPVENLAGLTLATGAADFWDGALFGAVTHDENGNIVSSSAWTGSNVDGTASGSDCGGWMVAAGTGTRGVTVESNAGWINAGSGGCNQSLHLYCVEQ